MASGFPTENPDKRRMKNFVGGMDSMHGKVGSWMTVVFVAALAGYEVSYAQSGTVTLVMTNQTAPGTPAGAVFADFDAPALNNAGQLAFNATLQPSQGGVTANDDTGLWVGSPTALTLAAREGYQAPDFSPGVNFVALGAPALNAGGQLAFKASFANNYDAIYAGAPASLSLVAFTRGPASTGSGSYYRDLFTPRYNDLGQVIFGSTVTVGSGSSAVRKDILFAGTPSDLHAVVEENSMGLGTPVGAAMGPLELTFPVINASGQFAFKAHMVQGIGGISADNDSGIWVGTTDGQGITTNLIAAQEGTQAPDLPAGATFNEDLRLYHMNAAGEVIFFGRLNQGSGGVSSFSDEGIWAGAPGNVHLVAREGDFGPGTITGFSHFEDPVLNASGQTAFFAEVEDATFARYGSVWTGTAGNLTQLVREGLQAPGLPAGANFAFLDVVDRVSDHMMTPVLNAGGQVLVKDKLTQGAGGVTADNDRGLWLFGPDGDAIVVARTGDVSPFGGALADVDIFSAQGNEYGYSSSLNDFGQVAYRARVTLPGLPIPDLFGLFLFTPELHWRGGPAGAWDNARNWTVGIQPAHVHDTLIDPDTDVTVSGPVGPVTVNSLTVGGGNGIGRLELGTSSIISAQSGQVAVAANGVLAGTGVVTGEVVNHGTVLANQLSILGPLTNFGLVSGNGNLYTSLANQPGGQVQVAPGRTVHVAGSSQLNQGDMVATGGSLIFDGMVNNVGQFATIEGRDATLQFNMGLLNQAAFLLASGFNQVDGAIVNTNSITVTGNASVQFQNDLINNGSIQVSTGSTADYFGAVSGVGPFTGAGLNVFHGVLSPGNSVALVDFGGNVVLDASSTTVMELGGPGPFDFDQIHVSSILSLDGILDVSLMDSGSGLFEPTVGDSFEILAADGGIRNEFNKENLPTLSGNRVWVVDYTENSVWLNVVASPLTADFDEDGDVDGNDFLHWQSGYGALASATHGQGDADADGDVDHADFLVWHNQFGGSMANMSTGSTSVPEPASTILLMLGSTELLILTKSKRMLAATYPLFSSPQKRKG